MGPDASRARGWLARKILVRSFFFAMALTALPFLYILYDPDGCCSKVNGSGAGARVSGERWLPPTISYAGGGALRSRYHFSSYDEYLQLQMKKTTNLKLRKLWTTRDWRRKVDVFTAIFQHLMKKDLIKPGAKALCIGARVGQEVVALRENGIEDAIGIDLVPAPPLVVRGDIHKHPFPDSSFDLEFSNVFDHALFPSLFVSEIERTLKPGGVAVIHLLLKGRGDKYSTNDLYSVDPLISLFHSSDVLYVREVDAFGLDTELVLRKRVNATAQILHYLANCSAPKLPQGTIRQAEPLIAEEPRKPWLTFKRNLKNIVYLPGLVDISNRSRYVYIDIGARNYGSSIGSWFKKQYPKQGHNFSIFAVEADRSFEAGYAKHSDVTLLPYAAWTRNETLLFGTSKGGGVEKNVGEGGMGRIQSLGPKAQQQLGAGDPLTKVQGFDFAEWFGSAVTPNDYVVLKMDVEGTEFDLLPRLFDTGGMCLVDELFLECHYNRWQKCCPERSSKYKRTYADCLALFQALRGSGVLVHQWW